MVTGSEMMRLCVDSVTLGDAGGDFVRVTGYSPTSTHSYPHRFNDPSIRSAHHPSNLPTYRCQYSKYSSLASRPSPKCIHLYPFGQYPAVPRPIHSFSGSPNPPRSKDNPIAEERASITHISHLISPHLISPHLAHLTPSHSIPHHKITNRVMTLLDSAMFS